MASMTKSSKVAHVLYFVIRPAESSAIPIKMVDVEPALAFLPNDLTYLTGVMITNTDYLPSVIDTFNYASCGPYEIIFPALLTEIMRSW